MPAVDRVKALFLTFKQERSMKTTIITPPRGEPISVAEAKAFLKITHTQEDELFPHLITTARQMAETYTRRKFMTQRLISVLPFRPNHAKKEGLQRVWTAGDRYALFLPRGPLQQVIEVERISEDGDTALISYRGYHLNVHQDPALLVVDDKSGWGVRITYEVGYGDNASDVPAPLRQALLRMISTMYQQRDVLETNLLEGVAPLLNPYRLVGGVL